MTRAITNEEWWLRLYNAKDNEELYEITYEEVGLWTRAANMLRKPLPRLTDALDIHWHSYKDFVNKWLDNSLSDADWTKARIWVGREVLTSEMFPGENDTSFTLKSFFIKCMKTNPNEPLTQAYKQIARRIAQERLGISYIRPVFCSACGRLFEPRQLHLLHGQIFLLA